MGPSGAETSACLSWSQVCAWEPGRQQTVHAAGASGSGVLASALTIREGVRKGLPCRRLRPNSPRLSPSSWPAVCSRRPPLLRSEASGKPMPCSGSPAPAPSSSRRQSTRVPQAPGFLPTEDTSVHKLPEENERIWAHGKLTEKASQLQKPSQRRKQRVASAPSPSLCPSSLPWH